MSNQKKTSPEETFQMIECGNLDLNFPIAYGILLLGNTKAGKTTTAHHLMHQDLEGGFNDKKSIVYKLRDGLIEYTGAKIGDEEAVSETQIPNFFIFDKGSEMGETEKTREKYIIDCPGYLDTFGCFRIITNRFFHYQVFSKVQNIKFVITINFNDMTRAAEGLQQTFKEFLKGFSNLNDIKEKLFKATCVMITAVPIERDEESVKTLFKGTSVKGEFDKFYAEFRDHLVGGNKIFMFKAAKLGVRSDRDNKILEEMNKKTEYWQRDKNKDGDVDMSNISISIAEYSEKDENNFKEEMESLREFYQEKIINVISTFVDVLKALVLDIEGGEDSISCITEILKYNDQMETLRKQQEGVCQYLYNKYENQRRELKDKLFKPINLFESESYVTSSEIPFWLCKIKSLTTIENLFLKVMNEHPDHRSSESLKDIEKTIKCILDIFISLFKVKKDRKDIKDTNYPKIIDYAYNIYKNINNSNKLYDLISLSLKNKKKAGSNQFIENGMNFILTEYPKQLRSIMLKSLNKNSIELFARNLPKLNLENNLTLKASNEVLRFLNEYQKIINNPKELQEKSEGQFLEKEVDLLRKLVIEKIAKIKTNEFITIRKEGNLTLSSIKLILDAYKENAQKINESANNAFDNQSLKVQNIRNIGILAECLHKNKKLDLAIELYDCLGNAHKIFEILNEKREEKKKKKESDSIDDLIEFMEMARKYHRISLAIEKGQEALYLAQDSANLEKTLSIAMSLKNICSLKFEDFDAYTNFLENPILDIEIPGQTYSKIERCIPASK